MAAHWEKAIIQHLVLDGSLQIIVERDLPPDLLPTPDLAAMMVFAVTYWHSDVGSAPTPGVMLTHYANILAEHEIDLEIDPEGTLEWALACAQGSYIDRAWQPWVREFAMKVGSSDVDYLEKPGMLGDAIEQLMAIQSRFVRRSEQVDVRVEAERHFGDYLRRADMANETGIRGAILGMPAIDQHIGGARDGELIVCAGPPKSGKSYLLLWGAYQYWLAGGSPVLFSLENSVEMTMDRLACMILRIDMRRWELGQCTTDEVARVRDWVDGMVHHQRPFHIVQPEPDKRTVEHLIRKARSLGDSVYIDQLTFISASEGSERRQKHEQIGILLHELKSLISSGRRMPCFLAHQINREGVKAAEKTGHLEMYHLAESSEVERTADRVLGLWQSPGLRDAGRAWIQTLASRRSDLVHWEVFWQPYIGTVRVHNEITLARD